MLHLIDNVRLSWFTFAMNLIIECLITLPTDTGANAMKFPPIAGGREDLILQLLTERRRAPTHVLARPGFLTHAETMSLGRLATMVYNTGMLP